MTDDACSICGHENCDRAVWRDDYRWYCRAHYPAGERAFDHLCASVRAEQEYWDRLVAMAPSERAALRLDSRKARS